jgi:hypothetical protein
MLVLGKFATNISPVSLIDSVSTYAYTIADISCKGYGILENRLKKRTVKSHKHSSTNKLGLIDIAGIASSDWTALQVIRLPIQWLEFNRLSCLISPCKRACFKSKKL